MRRLLLAAVVLGSGLAQADSLTGLVWGDAPRVLWDGRGAFVFELDGALRRYDVRTSDVAEVGDEVAGAVDLAPARTSPDDKASAAVKVLPGDSTGTWKAGVFTPGPGGDLELRVARAGMTYVVSTVSSIASADVYWSPDSRYIAWVIQPSRWRGGDGSRSVAIYVGASGPRAQVLAAPDVLKRSGQAAAAVVEGAGLAVVFVGPAKKARDRSVVYAARGFEAQAKQVAGKLAGGATVEALTWDAKAELVVALGQSALRGGR